MSHTSTSGRAKQSGAECDSLFTALCPWLCPVCEPRSAPRTYTILPPPPKLVPWCLLQYRMLKRYLDSRVRPPSPLALAHMCPQEWCVSRA
eukprot:4108358-Prymnesium_polylepis.1